MAALEGVKELNKYISEVARSLGLSFDEVKYRLDMMCNDFKDAETLESKISRLKSNGLIK